MKILAPKTTPAYGSVGRERAKRGLSTLNRLFLVVMDFNQLQELQLQSKIKI
jgi:hypothetical protein